MGVRLPPYWLTVAAASSDASFTLARSRARKPHLYTPCCFRAFSSLPAVVLSVAARHVYEREQAQD